MKVEIIKNVKKIKRISFKAKIQYMINEMICDFSDSLAVLRKIRNV